MNTKISKEEIARMFGYGNYTSFNTWDKTPNHVARFNWLKTSAILIKNGYNHFEVLGLAEKNKTLMGHIQILKEELENLTNEIHKCADKLEAQQ